MLSYVRKKFLLRLFVKVKIKESGKYINPDAIFGAIQENPHAKTLSSNKSIRLGKMNQERQIAYCIGKKADPDAISRASQQYRKVGR